MQPYIYMSIGINAFELEREDTEKLESLDFESYSFVEDFADNEQVFAFEVLQSPWDNAADKDYSLTKVLSVSYINKLYSENKEKIIVYQNQLKTLGLNHLVDKVDIVVHVTEV